MAEQSEVANQSLMKWLLSVAVLAVIGLGVSGYSLKHHMDVARSGSTNAACNINETFSCDDIAKSEYSTVFDIPVSIWGLGFFLALLVLAGLALKEPEEADDHIFGIVALTGIGILTSIGLFTISITEIGALCLTCIAVYVINLLLGAALGVFRKGIPWPFDVKAAGNGLTTAAVAVAACVVVWKFFLADTVPAQKTAEEINNAPAEVGEQVYDIPINKSPYSGLGEDYRKGNDDAKAVLVEFVDFQCPACAQVSSVLDQLHRDYKDSLLVVFKNYPLDKACNSSINGSFHDHACKTATLARCAGQYGKFWEFHNLAFSKQKELSAAEKFARQVGLTDEQIKACLADNSITEKIKDDVKLGQRVDVTGTPSLYLNGRKVTAGRSLDALRTEVDKVLRDQ